MDDWDLLEQFRHVRSEQAFGELVRRHAGFVLATCRRRLRDTHLSEDAAQAVFLVLARRPPRKLSTSRSTLAGWLYQTANHACNNAMRANRSRAKHERQAAAQATAEARHLSAVGAEHGIERVEAEAWVDRALAKLSSKERDAILLRFYQGQSVQQVGLALGISQNTATKRIGRAIERMREFLADKGVAIAAPVLIEAITHATRAPLPPPPEFIAQAISVAVGQSMASTSVQHLAEGVNQMIRVARAKLFAAVAAVVLTAGGGIMAVNQLMAQTNSPSRSQVVAPSGAAPNQRADASTPKAALHALAAAARAADVEQIKRLVVSTNSGDERLLLAACKHAVTQKAFLEAANAKFGEPATTSLREMLQLSLYDRFLKDLETKTGTLTETIEGNEAVFAMGGETGDVRLVRDDAGWKLAATSMTKDWPREKFGAVYAGVQRAEATLSDLTNQINDGKFATFDDLAKTVRGMMRGR